MSFQAAAFRLTLLSLMLLPSAVIGQDDLRWKFNSGETLKYIVQQKMDTKLTYGGNTFNNSLEQTMNMSWKVGTVAASGEANVSQTVDRVQMKLSGPPYGNLQFDTASTEAAPSPQVKAMSEVFRKIIGQDFAMIMKPTGKIQDVKIPETLLKSITEAGGSGNNPLTEESLRAMMEQSSVSLPAGKVAQGQTWESVQQVDLLFGQMKIVSAMTFEGVDSATGLAKIRMKPTITVTPKPNATIQMTLKSAEGVGQVLFDQAKGRIARSELDLNLQMQVVQQGNVVDQNVQQKTLMQLAP